MKTYLAQTVLILSALVGSTAWGSSVPGSLLTDYGSDATWLEKVTIGLQGEQYGRTVEPDGAPEVSLDVLAISAFLGYDVSPTTTLFGMIGGAEDNREAVGDDDDDSGSGIAVGFGANFNLASYAIRHPDAMVGDRVTFRLVPEAQVVDADTTDWWGVGASLPITYEWVEGETYFSQTPEDRLILAIYVGPQISYISGSTTVDGSSQDFEAAQVFGVVAGVDLYMTSVISVGAHVDVYDSGDDISGGGSFRYHF